MGVIKQKNPTIKLDQIPVNEREIKFIAEIIADGRLINTVDDISRLNINIVSNRYGSVHHRRYIQGYPDGEFKPDRTITRAEIAVAFARILKLEDLVQNEQMYDDVSLDGWYARGVEAATKRGLIRGYEDGTFKPDQPITRAELATVIARFLELEDRPPLEVQFGDINQHWAFNYIAQLYRNNVVGGYADGTFKPDANLRRSEAVTMINRMLYRGPLRDIKPSYTDVNEDHWAHGDVEESTRSHEYHRNTDGSETHLLTTYEELFF